MGRKGPRVGASSASAASRSGTPAFTSFAAATAQVLQAPTAGSSAAAAPTEWDVEALALLRAAARKDATTRARALADLAARLRALPDRPPAGVGRALVTAWGADFPALAADPAPAVRAAALDTAAALVITLRKATHPVLRRILPSWVAARGDAAPAVARAADAALSSAFPDAARKKLATAAGADVITFAAAELDAAREEGDPPRAARAFSAALWVLTTADSLDSVAPLLESGAVLRAVGGPGRAGRGAAPRHACEFAKAVVPYLSSASGSEEGVNSERTVSTVESVARIAEMALRRAEAAAWDLLLAFLDAGFGSTLDWPSLRQSLKSALSPGAVSPAALSSLLPIFARLPASDGMVTAEGILVQLRDGMMAAKAPASRGDMDARQMHGLLAVHVQNALPALLECLVFTATSGVSKWSCEDVPLTVQHLGRDHLQPVLVGYVSGALVPFAPRPRNVKNRLGGERKKRIGNGEPDVPQLFARALVAVCKDNPRGYIPQLLSVVFPLPKGQGDVSHRFSSLVASACNRDAAVGAELVRCTLAEFLLFEPLVKGGGKEFVDRDHASTNLAVIAELSTVRLIPSECLSGEGFDPRDIGNMALEYSKVWPDSEDIMASCGSILSWVAAAEGDKLSPGARSSDSASASSSWSPSIASLLCSAPWMTGALRASLCSATLLAHEGHRRLWQTTASAGSDVVTRIICEYHPIADKDLDGFLIASLKAMGTGCEEKEELAYADLLNAALRPDGGAAPSEETMCCLIETLCSFVSDCVTGPWVWRLCDTVLAHPAVSDLPRGEWLERLAAESMVRAVSLCISKDAALAFCARVNIRRQAVFRGTFLNALAREVSRCVESSNENNRAQLSSEASIKVSSLGEAWVLGIDALCPTPGNLGVIHSKACVELLQILTPDKSSDSGSLKALACNIFSAAIFVLTNQEVWGQHHAEDGWSPCIEKCLISEYERILYLRMTSHPTIESSVKKKVLSYIGGISTVTNLRDSPETSYKVDRGIICRELVARLLETGEVRGTTWEAFGGDLDVLNVLRTEIPIKDAALEPELLDLLEATVRFDFSESESGETECNLTSVLSVADVLGDVLLPVVVRVVAVCSSSTNQRGLRPLKSLFEQALVCVRRNGSESTSTRALSVLAAAFPIRKVDVNNSSESGSQDTYEGPQWLASTLQSAIHAVRRGAETKHLGAGGRNLVSHGACLVANALQYGLSLTEDDRRFWTHAALDAFREAEVADLQSFISDNGEQLVSNFAAMATFANAISDSRRADNSDDGVQSSGLVEDDLVSHGAWAGVRLLPLLLRTLGEPECRGSLGLIFKALDRGFFGRESGTLPIEMHEVYSICHLLSHNAPGVRHAVFGVLSTLAPRHIQQSVRDVGFSGDTYEDDTVEELRRSDLIAAPLVDALRWPANANPDEASLLELGFFLAWLLLLDIAKHDVSDCNLEEGPSSAKERPEHEQEDRSCKRIVIDVLRSEPGLYRTFILRCVHVVIDGSSVEKAAAGPAASTIPADLIGWLRSEDRASGSDDVSASVGKYAGATLAHALQRLPALSRRQVADQVEHGVALRLEDFVRRWVSQFLIAEEIRKVQEWQDTDKTVDSPLRGSDAEGELTIRGSAAGREVCATYALSDVSLQISLRLPEAFPLQTVEVDDSDTGSSCASGLGRVLWRKTLLGMSTLLRFKDGSIAGAIELWRRNLDKRLGGVEDCPVCYSVLHLTTTELPKMQCRTCRNMFHAPCLYKWFTKSSSRSCPMCRSVF